MTDTKAPEVKSPPSKKPPAKKPPAKKPPAKKQVEAQRRAYPGLIVEINKSGRWIPFLVTETHQDEDAISGIAFTHEPGAHGFVYPATAFRYVRPGQEPNRWRFLDPDADPR